MWGSEWVHSPTAARSSTVPSLGPWEHTQVSGKDNPGLAISCPPAGQAPVWGTPGSVSLCFRSHGDSAEHGLLVLDHGVGMCTLCCRGGLFLWHQELPGAPGPRRGSPTPRWCLEGHFQPCQPDELFLMQLQGKGCEAGVKLGYRTTPIRATNFW